MTYNDTIQVIFQIKTTCRDLEPIPDFLFTVRREDKQGRWPHVASGRYFNPEGADSQTVETA